MLVIKLDWFFDSREVGNIFFFSVLMLCDEKLYLSFIIVVKFLCLYNVVVVQVYEYYMFIFYVDLVQLIEILF